MLNVARYMMYDQYAYTIIQQLLGLWSQVLVNDILITQYYRVIVFEVLWTFHVMTNSTG